MPHDRSDLFTPPDAGGTSGLWYRSRRWVRRHVWWLALCLVVVVGITAASYLNRPNNDCGGPNSGVHKIGGECVGVTDGGYPYDSSIAGLEHRIALENAAVSGSGHTVTIALLDPLTVNDTSAVASAQVGYELEGAYTAQFRINHNPAIGDQLPLVRLVLANWGSHELEWQPVVEQLAAMVHDPDPLVAVVGLRLSTVQTQQAAQDLAQHNIPMVSSIATADELNYGAIRGFLRASPPNSEYVKAIQQYLAHRPELDSAMVVYDANSDANPDAGTNSGADLFTRSLRDDLEGQLAGLIRYPAQNYVGRSGPTPANPDLFTSITTNICAASPKVVLYAGRVVDFDGFLQSLRSRVCPYLPLTVIATGADFGGLRLREQEAALRAANISIAYATEADAQGWVAHAPGTPLGFKAFYTQFQQLGFAPADLNDGSAVSIHDALLIAAKAARLYSSSDPAHGVPSANDVLNQMLNLNNLNAVPGASGQMSFSYRAADSGNPSNKPIPVIEVPSSAEVQTSEVYLTK